MSIEVTCPNGHVLRVKREFAGRSGLCPNCQARIEVPKAAPVSEDDLLTVLGPPRPVLRPVSQPAASAGPPAPHHLAETQIASAQATRAVQARQPSVLDDEPQPRRAKSPGDSTLLRRRRVCPKCCQIVPFAHNQCPHCNTSLSGWSFPLPEESGDAEKSRSLCRFLGVRKQGNVMVIRFGEHRILDEASVKKFGDELFQVADRGDCKNVLLNFTGVDGLSSAMLGVMLMLRKKISEKQGKLKLCLVGPEIMEIFHATKLGKIFEILGTEQQALGAFG
jgi:anti-anti-sigma factor